MLRGGGYGNPVDRLSPPYTHPVDLAVDERPMATPAPYVAKYDNGVEVMFQADERLMETLAGGTTATVQVVSGTPIFEFPIAGAGEVIAAARRGCRGG
jgi:hypothetical protein